MFLLAMLFGGSLTACTATQIATATADVNMVIADIQTVCHAIVDNSTGAIAQLISTFPIGATALSIATATCNFINQVPPVASHRFGASPWQTTVINNVVIHFVKTQ